MMSFKEQEKTNKKHIEKKKNYHEQLNKAYTTKNSSSKINIF